jgi:hypothetical protein
VSEKAVCVRERERLRARARERERERERERLPAYPARREMSRPDRMRRSSGFAWRRRRSKDDVPEIEQPKTDHENAKKEEEDEEDEEEEDEEEEDEEEEEEKEEAAAVYGYSTTLQTKGCFEWSLKSRFNLGLALV